ncbi:hypothetical protein [uncultured Parabacteroides sp.]|uniref:hypothetical protein n=1 Tax=uncultured Parabacteroides sp. TaxID=512312 RepID=UPI00259BDC4E|nr:hypothetical protein [uncultured Parabacteroides sp.]
MAEALTPEQVSALAEQVAQILAAQSQGVGEITKVTSLNGVYSLPALLFGGSGDEKVVEAPLTLLRVWLQKTAEGIEWKQGDDGEWQVLIPIPDITGPQGGTPVFRTSDIGIEWKYESEPDTAWRELVSIDRLKLTFEMLNESQKEAIRGYSAYQLWEQEEGNNGKTYQDFKAWMKEESLEAADKAIKATIDTTTVKEETLIVKEETKAVQIEADKTRVETDTIKLDTLTVRDAIQVAQIEIGQLYIETKAVKQDTIQAAEESKIVQADTDQTRIKTNTAKQYAIQATKEAKAVQKKTDRTRVKTDAVKEDTLVIKEDTKAVQIEADRIRIETAMIAAETLQVKEDTDAVQIATNKTRIETDIVKNDTLKVKEETIIISEVTKELNDHPGKPIGGYWFFWDLETKKYKNSNIQAKGDVGSSFRILGRYDSFDDLKTAIPDGTNYDGVFAVGANEPYNYYAWLVVNNIWQWDNQGQLRGAEGKSAYTVWLEKPENEGQSLEQYFDWLSPQIDEKTGRWKIQGTDMGVRAEAVDAYVTVKEDKQDTYTLHVKSAAGEFDTPNLKGFDVKVAENPNNTPAEYKLDITTAEGKITTPNLQGRSASRVLDIDHEPGPTDTHYMYNEVQYAFSIGDEVRYYDPDLEQFVFYKCYDLTADGAAWDELGGGGSRLPTDIFLCSPLDFDDLEDKIFLNNGTLE